MLLWHGYYDYMERHANFGTAANFVNDGIKAYDMVIDSNFKFFWVKYGFNFIYSIYLP